MMTAECSRSAYARICVEIGVHAALPEFVTIKDPNGEIFEQPVEYEWVPVIVNFAIYMDNRQINVVKLSKYGRLSLSRNNTSMRWWLKNNSLILSLL